MMPADRLALLIIIAPSLVFILAFAPLTAQAYMTVGLTCTNNDTCVGENEFCYIRRDFDIPCKRGLCACLPGYILDGVKCAKKVLVQNLGDPCDLQDFGQYYGVDNADCYGGYVACNPGYYQRSNSCFYETTCSGGKLCPADMFCDSRQKCTCYYDKKFDIATQTCIKREFGDACKKDVECQVNGRDFNGFTFRSAACVDGQCVCSDGAQPTLATFIDRTTSAFRTKTICVSQSAIVNATNGTTCTLDPVYWSDIADTVVCDASHVCYQCPEDYQYPEYGKNFYGRCRRVLTPAQPSTTTTPVVMVTNNQTTNNSATSIPSAAEQGIEGGALSTTPKVEIIIRYFNRTVGTQSSSKLPVDNTKVIAAMTTPPIPLTPANTNFKTRSPSVPWSTTLMTKAQPRGGLLFPSSASSTVEVVSVKSSSSRHASTSTMAATSKKLLSWLPSSYTPSEPTSMMTRMPAVTAARILHDDDGDSGDIVKPLAAGCKVPSVANGHFFVASRNGTWRLMIDSDDTVVPGALVNLICESGLSANGGAARSACLIGGQWSDDFGYCFLPTTTTTTTTETPPYDIFGTVATFNSKITKNCRVPVVINGALSTDDINIVDVHTVRPGALVTLSCNGGYSMSRGSNESVCLTDGNWWKPLGICSRSQQQQQQHQFLNPQ